MLPRDGPALGPGLHVSASCVVVLLVTAGIALLLSWNLGANDLGPGDEGYCGIAGRNAGLDVRQLVNPSLSPMGPPGDRQPLHALLLAGAMRLGGVDEIPLRLVSVVLAVLVAPLVWLIGGALGSRGAGMWAAVLWLTSPVLAEIGRTVESDLLAVDFALVGVWCFIEALRRKRSSWALAAGVFFGLAFLTKLWLGLIPAVGVVGGGWLASIASSSQQRVKLGVVWRLTVVLACGLGLVGSGQLLACWLTTPEHVSHWLRVYFQIHLSAPMTQIGFAGSHKPGLYYVARLVRWGRFCIPMAGLGATGLVRRWGESGGSVLYSGILVAWLLTLIPLSLFSVKSPSYVLPVIPAVLLLAGLGVESLGAHLKVPTLQRRQLFAGVIVAAIGCVGSVLTLARTHEEWPGCAGVVTTIACGALWAAGALMATGRGRISRTARTVVVGCLAVAIAGGIGEQVHSISVADHVTGFARIARILEPGLRDLDPTQQCFIAPEWPSMSFYTFRSGRYWESPYVEPDSDFVLAALRGAEPFFFVVPTGVIDLYGGRPDSQTLHTIIAEAHPVEATPDSQAAVRVYVNEPLHVALASLVADE